MDSDQTGRRSFGVMDKQNKDGDSDSRESYGLKISELLKAEKKSPPHRTICIDPRNISTNLSILNNTGCTSSTGWITRSKAVLPENISQLSSCQFKRRDHLRESLVPVPAPVTAVALPQEGQLQPSLLFSNLIILAHLVEKSKMLPLCSVSCIGERLKKQEIHPHILGVQAWMKQQSCELWCTPPVRQVSPQTGPTNKWFFEDLTDLQRRLFLGASKKFGILSHSQTLGKDARHNPPESTSSPNS